MSVLPRGQMKDRPRSGRPRVTTRNTDRRIEGLAARRQFVTVPKIQNDIVVSGGQRISVKPTGLH